MFIKNRGRQVPFLQKKGSWTSQRWWPVGWGNSILLSTKDSGRVLSVVEAGSIFGLKARGFRPPLVEFGKLGTLFRQCQLEGGKQLEEWQKWGNGLDFSCKRRSQSPVQDQCWDRWFFVGSFMKTISSLRFLKQPKLRILWLCILSKNQHWQFFDSILWCSWSRHKCGDTHPHPRPPQKKTKQKIPLFFP